MPINKGFLTFRKQEYKDIQMKSIFRRRGEKGGECHMLAMTPKEKAATASVYGIQATAGVKPYLTATEKKC